MRSTPDVIIGFLLCRPGGPQAAVGTDGCPPAPWNAVAPDYLPVSEILISVLVLRRPSLVPHAYPPMQTLVHK